MPKFTRRDFIKASVATGIVAGAVAAPAVVRAVPAQRTCNRRRLGTATAAGYHEPFLE